MFLAKIFLAKLNGQRGGVALLVALGFLLLSIPLITGSLGLSQTINIDARVKTDIMRQDYCAVAVVEYFEYVSQPDRWIIWLQENDDPEREGWSKGPGSLCGETIEAEQLAPGEGGDGGGFIPTSGYEQRDIRTLKTVSDANPDPGTSVEYEITVTNRSRNKTSLTSIRDTLPPGFSYDCGVPYTLTMPGMDPVDILLDPCPLDSDITWSMDAGTDIEPFDQVTLTFSAKTSLDPGVYCNEAWVTPSGVKTSSGKTALVEIGDPAANPLCPGEAVAVSQILDSADLTNTDTSTNPFTYTFELDYTIEVENFGTEDLEISGIKDLLPGGEPFPFKYFPPDTPGDITQDWTKEQLINLKPPETDRWEYTWDSEIIPLPSGTSKTLKFTAIGAVSSGNYWVDLLVSFAGAFPEKVYTWPTAVFSVRDSWNVIITDEDDEVIVDLVVVMEGEDGFLESWNFP